MRGSEVMTGSERADEPPSLRADPESRPRRLSIRRFRLEVGVLLLLLLTFAALQFEDLYARRSLAVDPHSIGRFTPYWYDDRAEGGRLSLDGDVADDDVVHVLAARRRRLRRHERNGVARPRVANPRLVVRVALDDRAAGIAGRGDGRKGDLVGDVADADGEDEVAAAVGHRVHGREDRRRIAEF